jgi:tetratricopeptide (TPR) repeat protein
MGKKNKNKLSNTGTTKKNKLIIYLFFLVLVPFALYIRVSNYQFSSLDDDDIIAATYNINGGLNQITEAFTHDAFMSNSGDSYYRPAQTISFILDSKVGGVQPWIYHLSNLFLHILTVIALFFFLKKIGIKEEISFLLSILFSIHPLLTNAVAWIPARGDLLLGLFSILSFLTFLKYFDNRKNVYFILHAFVFLGAIFSKESAVLLPILILIYMYFTTKKEFNFKEIVPFILVWCFSVILFYFFRQSVVRVKFEPLFFGIIPFIKNLPVIPITFGKIFLPYNLSTLPLYDTFSLITGILLLIIFIAFIIKYSGSQKRFVVWGAIWFLAFTFPPMLTRTHSADFGFEYFEYRTYLPLIGILVIIGILAKALPAGITFNKMLKVTIPVFLIYGAIALSHLQAFSDPMSFFSSAINANSNCATAFNSRGGIYRDAGNVELALSDFDNAIKINSGYSNPYMGKGDLYRNIGDSTSALYFYSLALKYDTLYKNINNLDDNAYLSLSAMNIVLKKYDNALEILKKGADHYPGSNKIFNNMGYVYYCIGKNDSAIGGFDKAIEIAPHEAAYYSNRAKAEYQLKNYNSSLMDFNKSLMLDASFMDAYLNRGILKIDLTDYSGAIFDLSAALGLDSQSGEAYHYLGTAYSKMNKTEEAEKCWVEARKYGFKETNELKPKPDSISTK